MKFSDSQIKKLAAGIDRYIEGQCEIALAVSGHAEDEYFVEFSQKLCEQTDKLVVIKKKTDAGSLPGFVLKDNLLWSGLPLEKQADIFCHIIAQTQENGAESPVSEKDDTLAHMLDMLDFPVNMKLYVSIMCPHCPVVVKDFIPLAFYCDNIHLHIIDGSLFDREAADDSVMSVPCLILDNDLRWTAGADPGEIVRAALDRDPSKLSAESLRNFLEQGDAAAVAAMMIKKGMIFDNFVELLVHEKWSVRLGAVVVIEELAERAPELAENICPVLIGRFDDYDIPVQGDILYALGEAGNRETMEWIRARLPDFENPDLGDVAKEAIESINSRLD